MDMIAHAAEGMNPEAKSIGPFLKEEIKARIVFLIEEDLLPAVSPEHHVIDGTGKVNSGFPCHFSPQPS